MQKDTLLRRCWTSCLVACRLRPQVSIGLACNPSIQALQADSSHLGPPATFLGMSDSILLTQPGQFTQDALFLS